MTEPVAVNNDFYMRITRKVPGFHLHPVEWNCSEYISGFSIFEKLAR